MPVREPTALPGNQHGEPSGTIICFPWVAKYWPHAWPEASEAL